MSILNIYRPINFQKLDIQYKCLAEKCSMLISLYFNMECLRILRIALRKLKIYLNRTKLSLYCRNFVTFVRETIL